MKIEVLSDAAAVAGAGGRAGGGERPRRGGRARPLRLRGQRRAHTVADAASPRRQDVPWPAVHVTQVDERVAPSEDPDRNLTHLRESLLAHAPLRPEQVHAMPVEAADLAAAAGRYAATLAGLAGSPPALDLVHLGLGPDGHTASLVPGDPVLEVAEADVAVTGVYQGRRRMTVTYPLLDRARQVLWLVTGPDKVEMLPRLLDGDRAIPGGRVARDRAVVLADRAAAPRPPPG